MQVKRRPLCMTLGKIRLDTGRELFIDCLHNTDGALMQVYEIPWLQCLHLKHHDVWRSLLARLQLEAKVSCNHFRRGFAFVS